MAGERVKERQGCSIARHGQALLEGFRGPRTGLSNPFMASGLMYDACRQKFGVRGSQTRAEPLQAQSPSLQSPDEEEEYGPFPPKAGLAEHSSLILLFFFFSPT